MGPAAGRPGRSFDQWFMVCWKQATSYCETA
jgi:hypothetical protein